MRRLPHIFDRAGEMGSFFTIPPNQEVFPDLSAAFLLGNYRETLRWDTWRIYPTLWKFFQRRKNSLRETIRVRVTKFGRTRKISQTYPILEHECSALLPAQSFQLLGVDFFCPFLLRLSNSSSRSFISSLFCILCPLFFIRFCSCIRSFRIVPLFCFIRIAQLQK